MDVVELRWRHGTEAMVIIVVVVIGGKGFGDGGFEVVESRHELPDGVQTGVVFHFVDAQKRRTP